MTCVFVQLRCHPGKTYEVAEASAVQPFAYLQLVFASAIGIFLLGETLRPNVAIGAAIVVGAMAAAVTVLVTTKNNASTTESKTNVNHRTIDSLFPENQ